MNAESPVYRAFGLSIRSSLLCPELPLATGAGDADVTVSIGSVPATLSGDASRGVRFEATPGRFLLRVDHVARYLASDGTTVVVDPMPGSVAEDVRLFLLGPVAGALLHQRGRVVLRASLVGTDAGAAMLLGKSAAGKSTLAAALARRGATLLADDLCAVACDERPVAWPAYPEANLWPDSLERLGIDPTSLPRTRPSLEKRRWRPSGPTAPAGVPIREAFVLSPARGANGITLVPIEGAARLKVFNDYTYHREVLPGLGISATHFARLGRLADAVKVTRIVRPDGGFALDELADAVMAALAY